MDIHIIIFISNVLKINSQHFIAFFKGLNFSKLYQISTFKPNKCINTPSVHKLQIDQAVAPECSPANQPTDMTH